MNWILFIIFAVITILAMIALGFIFIYNKYQFIILKISEAENNIDIYLQKKLELLTRAVPILKEISEDSIADIEKVLLLKSKKLNNFELNKELDKCLGQLHELLDLNQEFGKNESLSSIQINIEENEDNLDAAKRYYNDNVNLYNQLIKKFPSNFIGLLFHYKHKLFYSDEKEEIFEILKK